MEKFITATGKTVDLAIEAALDELKLDRDSVSVEILENPKSGFLGIGAAPAKVKVTYEAPDEAPKTALSSVSRSKPKKPAAPAQEAPKPINPINPPKKQEKPAAPKAEKPAAQPKEYAPAPAGSVEEKIEQFLKGLLEHMGSEAVPHAWKLEDDTYQVDLVGDHLGALIGRRGETLDAIQHLTHYTMNRESGKHYRINVDAEAYRAKREESLKRLAVKVAGKVVKYRRNITLEPMNAYERHVIHAALQDMPNVSTHSTGSEPNRRVVVVYNKYSEN